MDIIKEIRDKTQSNISTEMSLIIDTLILYNPRISELLNLRKIDIIKERFVVCRGLKSSANIIIRDRELVSRFINISLNRKDQIFIYTNYHNVYAYVWKHYSSLINSISKGKKNKVTHLFRYLNTQGFNDEDSIKVLLHHNSKKSNHYYTNKLME